VREVLAAAPADRPVVLDVRTRKEYEAGCIEGAVNIPVDELRDRLGELPRDRAIAAYCQVGQRGYLATRILVQSGFRASNVSGGYATYRLWRGASPPSA
jgi:rhodanese-related sulfurtransferase